MYHDINVLTCCVRNFILKWLSLKEIFSCFGFNVQNFTTFYGPQFYHFLFSAIYFTTLFHSKEKGPRCTALQKYRERRTHFVLSCKIYIRNKLQIPEMLMMGGETAIVNRWLQKSKGGNNMHEANHPSATQNAKLLYIATLRMLRI